MNRAQVGRQGEQLAAAYLRRQGVCILAANYCVYGGEIDLIGFCRGGLYFFEVKTRSTDRWGTPAEAINREKLRHIERAAKQFARAYVINGRLSVPFGPFSVSRRVRFQRIDGVEVYLRPDGTCDQLNRIEDMGYEIRQHARTEE